MRRIFSAMAARSDTVAFSNLRFKIAYFSRRFRRRRSSVFLSLIGIFFFLFQSLTSSNPGNFVEPWQKPASETPKAAPS